MSNNKQSMKLYTEEQIIQMILSSYLHGVERAHDYKDVKEHILKSVTPIELPSDSLCINCDESESTHNICMNCIIKIGKENIQLPSDEEIDEIGKDVIVYNDTKRGWFIEGLKFMRDKIQGGNK